MQRYHHLFLVRNRSPSVAGTHWLRVQLTKALCFCFVANPEWLDLSKNSLSGTIPTELSWPKLQHLDLGHNQLTGTIPADWGQGVVGDRRTTFSLALPQLRSIVLEFNQLTGSLPKQWSASLGSGCMQEIILNNNQLTGEYPGRFRNQSCLVTLHLQDNALDKISKDVCALATKNNRGDIGGGSLADFRSDCSVCPCNNIVCGADECNR
jgi:Leucine Rich Repeat